MRAVALVLCLLGTATFFQPVFAQTKWEVVTSKEGQFSIEMPEEPTIHKTFTRKTVNGNLKTIMLGCNAHDSLYLVTKVTYPTAIVKEAEERELLEMRDWIVFHHNAKLKSQKKVRADGRIGLDFTMQSKDEDGVKTIRVREYLDGKSIYSIYVISPPNGALPEDTGRFLGSLALGTGGVRAAGKPEPEPAGTELKKWGLAIDPGNDCKITPGPKELTIAVPGDWHDLNPDTGKLNAPRVVQTVDGNFIVTVKVTGDFQPGGKSTNPKGYPFNGAGILVWHNSDNFIRLERGAMLRNGKVVNIALFEEREAGYRGALHNKVYPGGDSYLKMERKGSRIFGSMSFDGKTWHTLEPIDTLWPSKLKVGLSAINSSATPFSARFEEFTLKRGEL